MAEFQDKVRNRPLELQNEPGDELASPERAAILESFRRAVQAEIPPPKVADDVFDAIRTEQFRILTHSEWNAKIQEGLGHILQERTVD